MNEGGFNTTGVCLQCIIEAAEMVGKEKTVTYEGWLGMNCIAVIQARMGSTRLPGKTLKPLAGKPVLQHVVERVRAAGITDIVVAAPRTDTEIYDVCITSLGVPCLLYAGDAEDVFDRFRAVLLTLFRGYGALLRVTADCPLLEPDILRALVRRMEETDLWYISGSRRAGFCDGVGAEIVRTEPFLEIDPATLTDEEREHVTIGLPDRWPGKCGLLDGFEELKRPYKLSLDTQEDYDRLTTIFEEFGPEPDTRAVLAWLEGRARLQGRDERVDVGTRAERAV